MASRLLWNPPGRKKKAKGDLLLPMYRSQKIVLYFSIFGISRYSICDCGIGCAMMNGNQAPLLKSPLIWMIP